MAFLDTIFINKHKQNRKKSFPYWNDNSDKFKIRIYSKKDLSEDVVDTIISVIKNNLAKKAKLNDIAVDIAVYTGILAPIKVNRITDGVEVFID